MCGRYSLAKTKDELEVRFRAELLETFSPRYNVAPTQLMPVITSDSPNGFSHFYWGVTPEFAKNKPVSQKFINASAETIAQKASFKHAFQKRRCLIPADGFFEWKQLGKKSKIPHRFTLNNDHIFSFAGIWDEYENEKGEIKHTFLILTTRANELLASVHDRMPVILTQDAEKIWLSKYTSEKELLNILGPLSHTEMMSYPVSTQVNEPGNDNPSLIRKTSPMDQFGNYTLFG
ncbi:SOS response-associated peptidase [Anditalea andensis]|uniref:Abasic site processing protein n=1 Tax=Anditalea andensis TaxID=1048983 RepID=A0A074KX69_9BACT|nr:SOS response-associated peptidase [Anditalea andensis]KEO74566.1 hypothetical protein EL17_02510 [Anditalea andensis]